MALPPSLFQKVKFAREKRGTLSTAGKPRRKGVAAGKFCRHSRWLLRALVLRHRRRLFRVRFGWRLVQHVFTGLDEAQLLTRFFLDGAGIGSLQEVNVML